MRSGPLDSAPGSEDTQPLSSRDKAESPSIGNLFRTTKFKGTKSLACLCTMLEGRWRNDGTPRQLSRRIYAVTRAEARSVRRRTVSASMRSHSTVKPQPMPRGTSISPRELPSPPAR